MCGATSGLKAIGGGLSDFFNTLKGQAQSVFGASSKVFGDLIKTFEPIAAAGPNQQGFSAAENATLQSAAITQNANAYRNAATAVKAANAAVGGGNVALPGGAEIGQNLSVANAAAANTANELSNINLQNYEVGRENWLAASAGLEKAPDVFNPATSAANATTNAGGEAERAQNDISQQNNSWVNATIGALGNIAGAATTGGLSLLKPQAPAPTNG